jgi:DNA repair protein RadA/Sms
MAGGVRIIEPAVDLAVCCSIASSLFDKAIDNKTVLVGEIGLGGEIRNVNNIEKRIQEAEKLGFKEIIIPAGNVKESNRKLKISIIPITDLSSTINYLFKK